MRSFGLGDLQWGLRVSSSPEAVKFCFAAGLWGSLRAWGLRPPLDLGLFLGDFLGSGPLSSISPAWRHLEGCFPVKGLSGVSWFSALVSAGQGQRGTQHASLGLRSGQGNGELGVQGAGKALPLWLLDSWPGFQPLPGCGDATEVWLEEGHWLRGRFLGKVGEWICEDDSR